MGWSFLVFLMFLLVAPVASSTPDGPVILVLGDSLSAGYGIDVRQGWTQLLEERLRRQGYPYRVVNASISGDTTRGGVERLPRALERHSPAWVILELGGNDGLRGLSLEETRANLRRMIELSRDAGAGALLLGIKLPPNYGERFTRRFHDIYLELSAELAIPLVPVFLEGVADDAALMQADGIHPNRSAQPRLLENVWSVLGPMLQQSAEPRQESRALRAPIP